VKVAVPTAQLVEKARDPALPLHERHAAFAQLVEQTQHIVFGVALASLREVEDARDAAQDAFLTAWLRLGQLRDASLFPAWLRKIAMTRCLRSLRRRTRAGEIALPDAIEADSRRLDYESLLTAALATLPASERDVTVLFYFLGYSQPQIGRLLRLKPGTVGKRLHSARLRIRRRLPPSVRRDILRLTPSPSFVQQVRLGLFDEYVGDYRFDRRPDHVVSISREGQSLISRAGDQRHVLTSVAEDSLLTSRYDGEGRFYRDRRGKITHFVYYEFGRRLGIARKIDRRSERNG
jgi:RNA polymerase sigma-70 factor (ECF subfamily)